MKSTSAPATHGSSGAGNDRTVSTQSEYSGTSTGTYVVSIVGSLVVMAAVAAVVVARRKRQELEAMAPKESISSYMGALTPRGEINVMHA
ncbi:Carbohydrate-binding protein [Phytophthora palmivora]|uniref:Carbohydrate-binding protein n=1 Tax=Phytophthora palmivora TaxID=4796 RepID=A0A2P4YPD0_9STRA|nr:Carbohydrate-binding protein [Phytophthora palmivora]